MRKPFLEKATAFSLSFKKSEQNRWFCFAACAAVLLAFPVSPAFAQLVGDPCSTLGELIRERGIGAGTGIVCNGATYDAFQSYAMSPLRHGVNMTTPQATLDVNGEVRIGSTAIACSATNEGAIRWNTTGNYFEDCDGTSWGAVDGGGTIAIDDLTDAYTIYDAGVTSNFIMGRAGAAALTAGATQNLFIGEGAGATTANSTAATDRNTAVGFQALLSLRGAVDNTAIGMSALRQNTTGSDNTAVGREAARGNTTGSNNIAIGESALNANTTGSGSTAIGDEALSLMNGGSNIAIGYQAGNSITFGSANILLGYDVDTPTATTNNWLNIGDTITADLSTDSVGIGTGTTALVAKFVVAPPATETIAAAAVITANACGSIKPIQSTGNQTTNTTDTFTAPTASYAGCCMDVINVDTADTITLDANAKFKTAGGANIALGPDDTVRVCSNGANWYQISAASANQ